MKRHSNKYLWGMILVVVAFIGVKVIASSESPQVDSVVDGQLTISETNWDLGDIPMSEGVTTKSISFTNETAAPITITSMQTSCMCTTVQIVHSDGSKSGIKGMVGHGGTSSLSETIQAGEGVTLLVKFDPNAHGPGATGPITRNVDLETNSQAQPKIELTFSGNVVKSL